MEPILSKEEISELLAAIKTGEISTDSVDTRSQQAPRFLLAREIDLFQTYQRKKAEGEIRIPNFDIIIDMFARNLGTSLTSALQRTFSVERADITSTTFQQSLVDLNNQGAVGIFNTDPLKHGCLFHFDSFLAFSLLEMMLGSGSQAESITLDRTLTTIEISILKNTMKEVAKDLKKSFAPITAIRPKLTKIENNFRLVNIVEAESEVLVATFNTSFSGEKAGKIRLIIPYITLEPYRDAFRELVTVTQGSEGWKEVFIKEALRMDSLVIARSGMLEMTIRDILKLRVGDIVDLGYDPDRPLHIVVEEQPKFFGVPGERNGKKAFHITGNYSNSRLGAIYGNT